MFFKMVLITGILYVCLKMLCVNLRLTQPMLDWGESKAQLQNKIRFLGFAAASHLPSPLPESTEVTESEPRSSRN